MTDEQETNHAFARSLSNAGLGLVPVAWKHHTYDACNTEYDEVHGYIVPLYAELLPLFEEIERLRNAIQRALDDEESGTGWGPDVTVCGYLREALMPNV